MAIEWKQFVPQEILTSGDFQTYAVNNGMVQVDTAADLAGVDAAVHTCFVRNENPTGGVSVAVRAYRNGGWIRHIVADKRPDIFAPDDCLPGSTYTCTDPDTFDTNGNFGAAKWRKTGDGWTVTEGDTGWHNVTMSTFTQNTRQDDRVVRRTAATQYVHLGQIQFKANTGGQSTEVCYMPTTDGRWGVHALGSYGPQFVIRYSYSSSAAYNGKLSGTGYVTKNGKLVATDISGGAMGNQGYGPPGFFSEIHLVAQTNDLWPTVGNPATLTTREQRIEDRQAEIEAVKDDPDNAERLEQLRAELETLLKENESETQ